MTVITVLAGGKIISKETGTAVKVHAADKIKAITVTMNDLRMVEDVVQIHLSIVPAAASGEHIGFPVGTKITNNVVGFTVSDVETAAGSTITPTVTAIGYA